MEHLNRTIKSGITALGPNKREATIVRLGKAIGVIDPTVNHFDEFMASQFIKRDTNKLI